MIPKTNKKRKMKGRSRDSNVGQGRHESGKGFSQRKAGSTVPRVPVGRKD